MGKPLGLFGIPSEDIINKVIKLRKKVRELGYVQGEQYLLTLPHLTLVINHDFTGSSDEIKAKTQEIVKDLSSFSLEINGFIAIDNNIAAEFDNSYSKKLAQDLANKLQSLGFKVVETNFMKIIRSEVKPEFYEKVKGMVVQSLSKSLKVEKLVLAGELIRETDILWEANLR